MQKGIRSAGLILALLAPVLAFSQPQRLPAPPAPAACGLAPWTGTCACSPPADILAEAVAAPPPAAALPAAAPGRIVPYPSYAAMLRKATGAAAEPVLRAERRRCRLPDAVGSSSTPAMTLPHVAPIPRA